MYTFSKQFQFPLKSDYSYDNYFESLFVALLLSIIMRNDDHSNLMERDPLFMSSTSILGKVFV